MNRKHANTIRISKSSKIDANSMQTTLVINKDHEGLQYKYEEKKNQNNGESQTYQEGNSIDQPFRYRDYDTELNTYMKNQRESLR